MVVRTWTPAEDALLRRRAPTSTAKQLARSLGRTPNAVHQRAYRLRVRLQKAGDLDYRTKYPDRDVEQARALHESGMPPSEIARKTGIPIGSIKSFVYYRGRAAASLVLVHEVNHAQ